ncbi:MAG TPA: EAL domain-containing protein, partial [Rhodocyclaceae bacterium]|nr:EAL domain-containing protein [Rhodocyclaceae bacterium]
MSDHPSPPEQFFLGRQPILDREQRLVAYELLFRSSQDNAANFACGTHATATVIANAFSELSVADSLGDCLGFINVDEDFLFSDLLEILPRENIVLEILETVTPTPEVVARCRELKAAGFRLALDDVTRITPAHNDLLALADIIKVDLLQLGEPALNYLVGQLKPLGKQLLAEKVDTIEQHDRCLALGFTLFQGYYFAKPTIIAGKKMNHSQLSLMTLMGLLMSDADTSELENVFKPEPGLTVSLLRMTNSAGAGTTVRITSLRHAITILGRRQLQRWLQLLLFAANGKDAAANPLLQFAATRGRLMELLAKRVRPGDTGFADQAFMVGIMSLMPALVGLPMNEVISPLSVAPEVKSALCEGGGTLGNLLRLTIAAEMGEPAEIGPF